MGSVKYTKTLYLGALGLEALVLVALWLVGRHFSL